MNDLPYIPGALDDAGLSPRAFRLYCHLCRRRDGGDGSAWGSVENMARVCAMNRKTAILALAELVAAGLARRESRAGRTSVYYPLPPGAATARKTRSAKRAGEENGPAPETGGPSARKTDRHPARKTGYKGSPLKVLQRRNSPPPPQPPPTPTPADAGGRGMKRKCQGMKAEAERIAALYPANGGRMAAERHCLRSLKAGADAGEMAEAVEALSARWRALSPERRRYCPALDAFFRDERWRDSPDLHPWTVAAERAPAPPSRPGSRVSFPAAQPLKIRAL